MGACLSYDTQEENARVRSRIIDSRLEYLARQENSMIKVLLLGAGESGKSTLVKQMKIIHSDGFTKDELESFKPAVLDNVTSSMKYVLTGMGTLRINLENQKNKVHALTVLTCQCCTDAQNQLHSHVATALRALWRDRGVRYAVARGYDYDLNDSAVYYFDNLERICSATYSPTCTDVLRARVRTTGVIETCFSVNGVIIRLFDVGGQRSERRKWIQCFDDVRAVLFVVSLSGYDMKLMEDPSRNRMEESLNLFKSIVNNAFFTRASMILFMNKLDLFRQKITQSGRHLRYFFPDYSGRDQDVERAADFIRDMFRQQMSPRVATKPLVTHYTTATDTNNIHVVVTAVMQNVVRENLRNFTVS